MLTVLCLTSLLALPVKIYRVRWSLRDAWWFGGMANLALLFEMMAALPDVLMPLVAWGGQLLFIPCWFGLAAGGTVVAVLLCAVVNAEGREQRAAARSSDGD